MKNITKILKETNLTDKFVASTLRKKLANGKSGQTITLFQGQSRKEVKVVWKSKLKKLNKKFFVQLQSSSVRKRKRHLALYRKLMGRAAAEPGIEKSIKIDSNKMAEQMGIANFTAMKKNGKNITYDTVTAAYVTNVPAFVANVIEERKIKDPVDKIGMDGGQGSFKVMLSVVDKSTSMEKPVDSVKDAFLLFVGFKIQENRFNVKHIWNLLKLDDLKDYVIVVDLKLANLLVGIMGHSSKHPCCFCVAKLVGGVFDPNAQLRTIGSIKQ